MIDPALRAALAVFDHAALATLANAGLVRRAARDLTDGKVRLVVSAGAQAVIEADEARVTIDARGPKHATCTCTAAGVCRHRLAAVLLLQTAYDGDADDGPPASEPPPPLDPVAMLEAFLPEVVERWSGKAAWRAALEIAGEATGVTIAANGIAVAFSDLGEPVLILAGQGLDNIVSKAPRGRAKVVHAAAIVAARRHFGLAERDSDSIAEAPLAAAIRPDPLFLAQVETALADGARFAFNLAPEPVEEALFALSVSSRADALPRLSGILRALAGQLRQKRRREFGFDPDACLERLATGFALVRALDRDEEPTAERQALLHGAARQHYAPSEPLTLVGCGSEMWRTASGARGVTGIFYDLAKDRWLTAGLARGAGQDPLFDPAHAYRSEALWGTNTLATVAGRSLRIEQAGLSASGRISNPAAARAQLHPGTLPDRSDWPARMTDWALLEQRLAGRIGIGVGDLGGADYALLAPARFAAAAFDDLTQELIWPVADAAGRWLALTAGSDQAATAQREQIEELARRRWCGEVLVRTGAGVDGISLSPVAILSGGDVLSLGLDSLSKEGWRSDSILHWLPKRSSRLPGQTFVRPGFEASRAELETVWQQLIDLAEAGTDRVRSSLLDRLIASARRLDTIGMPTLASQILDLGKEPRERFLAASYALVVARGQRRDLPWLRPENR